MKSLSHRTARRIMVRLARVEHYPTTYWSIVAMATGILSWTREQREAWIAERYDTLTRYLGFSEEDLAIVVANVV